MLIFNSMLKHKQRILGSERGSCLKTSIACIMDLPLSAVPNFIDKGPDWFHHYHNWFARRGYRTYITTYKSELQNKNKLYVVGGQSPRFNCGHAVIYKGDKPYWDPHPEGTFIVGEPTHIYVIKKSKKEKIWKKHKNK